MNKFIVDYNIYFKRVCQFAGFDLTEQIIDENCKRITLDEFNTMEFDDSDLVILPIFTMHNPSDYSDLYSEFANKLINQKNYNREKTIIILGSPREAVTNYEATHQNIIAFQKLNKQNQKIKIYVTATIDSPDVSKMTSDPHSSVVYMIGANSFLQMSKFNFLGDYRDRDGSGQAYLDNTTDLTYASSEEIFEKNIDKIDKLENRNYLYTMLTRSSKPDRFVNFYNSHRYEVFDKGLVSYSNFNEFSKEKLIDILNSWRTLPTIDFLNFFDSWKDKPALLIDKYAGRGDNLAFNLEPSHYLDSYIQVISESHVGDEFIFITEKTYKSILCGSPFFILGNTNILNVLRERGFKTFDKWWDESYDDLYSHWERSKFVFYLLHKLSKLTKNELSKMISEQKEIIIHNRDNLKKLIDNDNYLMDIINYISEVTS
jgi:hypothetical protein